MEKEIIVDVYDQYPDNDSDNCISFRFKEEELADFLAICVKQKKYIVIYKSL